MIPVNEPLFIGNEKKYLNKCIDTGWISSEGPFIQKFEKQFSTFVQRKYGVAVSSGTAALDIAIKTLELKPGDEIILPSFVIISCIMEIVREGLIPVLVDSDPDTWNMDVDSVENKINDNTKAIMIVHTYGLPVDIDPLLDLAKKYNLKIIEDAAEVIGQTYKKKKCGSFGDISLFSFYPNKHITTGEGGMVVTDNEVYYSRAKSYRNLCFQPEKRFVHEALGWNYRMTNLQAALGLAQLENIEKFVIKKREIGKLYYEKLNDTEVFRLPVIKTNYAENIFWVFGLVIKEEFKITATQMMGKLKEKGIGTRPFFYPMHLQPIFKKMNLFINQKYPVAEYLSERGFYIPSGLALNNDNINEVVGRIKETIHEF